MTTDAQDVYLSKPGTIPQKGTDCPVLKYLYKHVKVGITNNWYEIGVELLDPGDEVVLDAISSTHHGDVDKCTAEMLKLWLARKPEASWNVLLMALKEPHIKLNTLASTINGMLLKDPAVAQHGASVNRKRKQDDIISDLPSEPFSASLAKKINTETENGIEGKDDCSFKDIDFRTIDKVSNAFSKLFSTFQKATDALSDKEFERVKNACVTRTDQANERLCSSLRRASNSEHLFEALAPYCNWMCIEYLETIAYAYKNDSLLNLIKNYSQVIFSKPLREVWNYVPFYSVKDKYYTELTAIFEDKDPDNLTVEELNRRKPQLAKEIAMLITVVRIQSLLISWLIPTSKVYQTYLSFLTVPQQLRNDSLVKFGNWMAYLPQFILQEQQKKFGMLSTSTLLIGYYHGLLLRDTNADSLIGDLYFTGLLTAQGLNVILSSHSSHYRNWLLLEYVRHMDSQAVLAFSELVKDVWPRIGIQLIATLTSAGDDFDNIIQKENNITFIFGFNFSYIEPSSVLTRYFQVSDSVVQLLSTWPVEMLLDVCENLMACGKSDIKLFSDNQMKKLKNCNSSLLLLHRLSLFFTWSNHSILRVLADHCSEAVNILDDFDCRVDSFELIASYPIPCFSLSMIPFDSSSHTIVAIRCDQELYECSLQYVYDMQSVMMDKCDITQHCLQLLAVRSDPTILYWSIPKCVVCLINDNVSLNIEYLYSRGIREMLVYPDLVFTFDDHVSIGLFAFCDDSKLVERKHADDHAQECHKSLQETVEGLKADKNILEEKLQGLSAELQVRKVATSDQQKLHKKMASIKSENAQLNKQKEQHKLASEKFDQLNKELHSELQRTKQNNAQLDAKLQETAEGKDQVKKLTLKLEEIKEKKDWLDDQNRKLNSELRQLREEKSETFAVKLKKDATVQDDDNDEEQQQQYHHDSQPNVAIFGRVDESEEESEEVFEVNTGKGESIELRGSAERNIEMKPLNEAVVEESQSTVVPEESQTGASKQQERVVPLSTTVACTEMVTGDSKPRPLLENSNKERAKSICKAVSEYYKGQFIEHWKTRTKQECGKIKVVAALLVEKRNKMRVVTLTAGTKHKTECSYFVKKANTDDHESCWGLCDGHAEAVCYRLASVYLLTEIYKLNDGEDSIFEKTPEGYTMKPNIYFHLFSSHPPCGFMARKERHLLSWKQPFKGKPHSLQCSSQILISAYLGIQGFLSHLLVSPIYVTSVTIPRYESVTALHGTYIADRLQEFRRGFSDLPESEYCLHIPHVEIMEVDVLKFFPECYRPYISEKPSRVSTSYDPQLPQQETTTVAKQSGNKGAKQTAFSAPDVIGNHGINAMVFTLEDGIGTKEFRESVKELKCKLIQLPVELKQRRFQSLKDAQIRLSQALNVSEALGVLKQVIIQKMDEKYMQRFKKVEEIIPHLKEATDHKSEIKELKVQVCRLKEGLGRAMQMNNLKSIVNALSHNLDYQVMLNDLESLLEEEKSHNSKPEFYLNLMGCNWVRYMKTIKDNIND